LIRCFCGFVFLIRACCATFFDSWHFWFVLIRALAGTAREQRIKKNQKPRIKKNQKESKTDFWFVLIRFDSYVGQLRAKRSESKKRIKKNQKESKQINICLIRLLGMRDELDLRRYFQWQSSLKRIARFSQKPHWDLWRKSWSGERAQKLRFQMKKIATGRLFCKK